MASFDSTAKSRQQTNIVSELWYFLRHNKKWWLLPIVAIMMALGVLLFLSGTAIAPFIYTLF